jgi:hypothetical protein
MNNNAEIAKPGDTLTLAGCLDDILTHVCCPITFPMEEGEEEKGQSSIQAKYDYVCGKLDITSKQAELFAAIIELCIGGIAKAANIADELGCTNLHFLELCNEIDRLIEKRYVRRISSGFNGICYRVPVEVLKQIQANKVPKAENISGLSTSGIIYRASKLFKEFWKDEMDRDILHNELQDLLQNNENDPFVKEYLRRGIDKMRDSERTLFMYMVVRRCIYKETDFGWFDFGRLFNDTIEGSYINEGIDNGDLELMKAGIIEYVNDDGIVDKSQICFVEAVINAMVPHIAKTFEGSSSHRNIINKDRINAKSLFYNENEGRQVANLTNLLRQENFTKIVARLKQNGMRAGFCCLFYGGPGTGKTESVYQIARQTGRDIFLVDVSQLRSKWVGESEKNMHALFNEYKSLVKTSEVAPILLFNEADAIFGVRKKRAEGSVDKMENTLQNIILQEMESLEGIMIATTNLTENLDPAFERRFIVKVNFQKPNLDARAHIWESMVEGLQPESAKELARDFDFSGGQIENISRMATVSYILNGIKPNLEGLRELCRNERLATKEECTKIGF